MRASPIMVFTITSESLVSPKPQRERAENAAIKSELHRKNCESKSALLSKIVAKRSASTSRLGILRHLISMKEITVRIRATSTQRRYRVSTCPDGTLWINVQLWPKQCADVQLDQPDRAVSLERFLIDRYLDTREAQVH